MIGLVAESPVVFEPLLALGAASQFGDEVAVALLGDPAAAEGAGAYGATQAFVFDDDLAASGGEAAVAALTELAREVDARAVLLPRDDRSAEIAPRLAERLGGTAVTLTGYVAPYFAGEIDV